MRSLGMPMDIASITAVMSASDWSRAVLCRRFVIRTSSVADGWMVDLSFCLRASSPVPCFAEMCNSSVEAVMSARSDLFMMWITC